jgi:hypothetical protein
VYVIELLSARKQHKESEPMLVCVALAFKYSAKEVFQAGRQAGRQQQQQQAAAGSSSSSRSSTCMLGQKVFSGR